MNNIKMEKEESKKRQVFLEVLKDLKRHFRPKKQLLVIHSIIFSIVFLISMIRIAITSQGILFYIETNIVFSVIIGICINLFLIILDTIRELHFTYHSTRLGTIKKRLREKNQRKLNISRKEGDKTE